MQPFFDIIRNCAVNIKDNIIRHGAALPCFSKNEGADGLYKVNLF
jgi:hypothetical protein